MNGMPNTVNGVFGSIGANFSRSAIPVNRISEGVCSQQGLYISYTYTETAAPQFVISAQADSGTREYPGSPLQRLQLIKGWYEDGEMREQVMDGLLKSNPVEIPETLKHQEMHALQKEAMQRMGLEDAEHAPPLDNFKEGAEKRVALGLLLRQVIVDKEITVNEEMMRARVEELCAGYENSDDMVNMYMSNPQVMQQIEPMVVEQQAVNWIIDNGKTKDKKVAFKEFMNPPAS